MAPREPTAPAEGYFGAVYVKAMKLICSECDRPIPSANINVAADVAVCPACDEAFTISELLARGGDVDDFDPHDPPKGAWFEDTGLDWEVGATTRSWFALFIVPFTCVWSGGSMAGIYGTQFWEGKFDLTRSLFGIPFAIGTLFLVSLAAMTICGKFKIAVQGHEGRVFTGVGPIGWTRRFDWSQIKAIEEDYMSHQQAGSSGRLISLVGQARLNCASMVSDSRRYFIMQVLRMQLRQSKG